MIEKIQGLPDNMVGFRSEGEVVKEDLEFYSVMRSVRAIENSDVCLLVIDATRGFEGQDQSIFWLAEKNRKGIVILVNKWDLVEKDTMSTRDYENKIKELRRLDIHTSVSEDMIL